MLKKEYSTPTCRQLGNIREKTMGNNAATKNDAKGAGNTGGKS